MLKEEDKNNSQTKDILNKFYGAKPKSVNTSIFL